MLAICDLKESANNLRVLVNKLDFNKVITFEECHHNLYSEHKMIVFFLNPESIGNYFFINQIKDILETRKNKQSIYFVIDGKERIDKKESLRIKIELQKSIMNFIPSPKIFVCSTKYMAIYEDYKIGRIALEDLQKDRNFFLIDSEGYVISGKGINEEHILNLGQLSCMQDLIDIIKIESIQFRQVDVTKLTWGLYGDKNSGKSTFKQVLEQIHKDVELIEIESLDKMQNNTIEGLIILLTQDYSQNKKVLNEVKGLESRQILKVVVNKWDRFMYADEDKMHVAKKIETYTKETLGQVPEAYVSSYYAQKGLELEKGHITVAELELDKELVLLDSYGFPIIHYDTEAVFIQCFNQQNSLSEFRKISEWL